MEGAPRLPTKLICLCIFLAWVAMAKSQGRLKWTSFLLVDSPIFKEYSRKEVDNLCAEVTEDPTMMSSNLRLEITCNSKTVHHETHGETDDLKHRVYVRSWNILWYNFYRWRYGFSWRTKHLIHSILFWPLSWSLNYRLCWNVPNITPS
jgi:hypothetical protein